jgi:hypothetical protein
MPLARDFKETIRARVERDPKFRQALLRERVEAMLAGDPATAKTILRDYINAPAKATHLRVGIARSAQFDESESVTFLPKRTLV